MDFVMSSHLFPVPLPRPQCANPKRRRGSLNLATSVRPAPLHVSESFSHNGRGSHPELSASLFPISFPRQTKAGRGRCFQSQRGREASRADRDVSPHTYSSPSPLSVSHNKGPRRTKGPTSRPLSISDRSLESVLQPCYPNTIRSREALNLFGFRVAIAQLGCKAAVCVSGTD